MILLLAEWEVGISLKKKITSAIKMVRQQFSRVNNFIRQVSVYAYLLFFCRYSAFAAIVFFRFRFPL